MIGECEISLASLAKSASYKGFAVKLTGKHKDAGSLEFVVNEPTQARSKYYLEL